MRWQTTRSKYAAPQPACRSTVSHRWRSMVMISRWSTAQTGKIHYRTRCEHPVNTLAFLANDRSFVVDGLGGRLSLWHTGTDNLSLRLQTLVPQHHRYSLSITAFWRRCRVWIMEHPECVVSSSKLTSRCYGTTGRYVVHFCPGANLNGLKLVGSLLMYTRFPAHGIVCRKTSTQVLLRRF